MCVLKIKNSNLKISKLIKKYYVNNCSSYKSLYQSLENKVIKIS